MAGVLEFGTLHAMRPCSAVGRAWLLAVAATFLVVLSAESAEFLPTCAPWRGQRSFVVDVPTMDVFIMLGAKRPRAA